MRAGFGGSPEDEQTRRVYTWDVRLEKMKGGGEVNTSVCTWIRVRQTYEPSGLRDSGMTRSRVRGSTEMPATVVSGTIAGLDMMRVRTKTKPGGGSRWGDEVERLTVRRSG